MQHGSWKRGTRIRDVNISVGFSVDVVFVTCRQLKSLKKFETFFRTVAHNRKLYKAHV